MPNISYFNAKLSSKNAKFLRVQYGIKSVLDGAKHIGVLYAIAPFWTSLMFIVP